MGYPNSWMVDFMENPNLGWMMTGGTRISGNLQILVPNLYIYKLI